MRAAMGNEYEFVKHTAVENLKVFLVNLVYREPHIHGDIEIDYILDGSVTVRSKNQTLNLKKNSFLILNSCQVHELQAEDHALILALQITPGFCKKYYPQFSEIEFHLCNLGKVIPDGVQKECLSMAVELARHYYQRKKGFEFRCMGLINMLFYNLINHVQYNVISAEEQTKIFIRNHRIRRIASFIETHYTEKLLLVDIAREEKLSVSYLSHFFRDNFGITFQEYLMSLRCEKARRLLLLTNHNVIDISMENGFSDIKYLNRGFRKRYGCSPKQYRQTFSADSVPIRKKSVQSTQEFLSDNDGMAALSSLFPALKFP
jgi:AraC-like DNA-binding protein